MMKKTICSVFIFGVFIFTSTAQHVIRIVPEKGDMTARIQAAIEKVREYKGRPVVIEFQNADYHIYRESSSRKLYYVSNTTSELDNPDPTKHIGLWFKGLRNVTVDGKGARIVTHGEMSCFVIDGCRNIKLRNLTITAADPTVPELTVTEVGERYMNVCIHPQSEYVIEDGRFSFVGHNWKLSKGIAQIYDPGEDITWRSWSPLSNLSKAVELKPDLIRFVYDAPPQARPGMVFQMRDGYRDEVCGLIQYSRDVTLEHVHFAFLGNFGIVGQVAENLIYRHLTFEPEFGSGRTCAGFADFVQMSGCKGRILIENCRFSGAQDDPINIHGTHLAVREFVAPDKVVLRYMHPQTYGFQCFFPGNTIEFIHSNSLMPLASHRVRRAEMRDEREILVTLDKPVPESVRKSGKLVVENVTYTPEVIIRHNFFSRIPSRGLLVTTRRSVLIENNVFFRMQMSGILIADDARSWFESGMVRDVTIRGNHFIGCNAPVVFIAPENSENKGYVHRNIRIENNRFQLKGAGAISAKSVDGLYIKGNLFHSLKNCDMEELVSTQECHNIVVEDNIVETGK